MRAVSHSVLALLILGALFWGNCLSCPQMLLSLASGNPPHGCCPNGKKPVTSSEDCQSLGLQHFVKAAPAHQAPSPTAQGSALTMAAPIPHALQNSLDHPWLEFAQHSPPGLHVLNSTFRI